MTNIGFIGLGIMGSRMAHNLIDAGHSLTVYNRTPHKADPLVEAGATRAASPAGVTEGASVVISMLAHPQAVEACALGEGGFLPAMAEGTLWMDCSTVHPAFSRRMAEAAARHAVRFMDAPVGGTKQPAAEGKLTFIVGAAEADLEEARPLMDVMGQRVIHVGEVGMGVSLKVVVNYMLATSMVAFAEGASLGLELGIPQDTLFEVLIGSAVTAPYLKGKQPKMESRDYEADFPLRWMRKDLSMAAEASGGAMPLRATAAGILQQAMDAGYADDDFSAVFEYLRGKA